MASGSERGSRADTCIGCLVMVLWKRACFMILLKALERPSRIVVDLRGAILSDGI